MVQISAKIFQNLHSNGIDRVLRSGEPILMTLDPNHMVAGYVGHHVGTLYDISPFAKVGLNAIRYWSPSNPVYTVIRSSVCNAGVIDFDELYLLDKESCSDLVGHLAVVQKGKVPYVGFVLDANNCEISIAPNMDHSHGLVFNNPLEVRIYDLG